MLPEHRGRQLIDPLERVRAGQLYDLGLRGSCVMKIPGGQIGQFARPEALVHDLKQEAGDAGRCHAVLRLLLQGGDIRVVRLQHPVRAAQQVGVVRVSL
jgi:hypothetical protein